MLSALPGGIGCGLHIKNGGKVTMKNKVIPSNRVPPHISKICPMTQAVNVGTTSFDMVMPEV